MNMKKILLFAVILMIAASAVGIVSAGWFDFGGDDVGGVKFNLTGFKEVTDKDEINKSILQPRISLEGQKNVGSKLFEDGDKQDLMINVYESSNGSFSPDDLNTLKNVSSKMKISKKNYGGRDCIQLIFKEKRDIGYIEDGKLVVLTEANANSFRDENGDQIPIDDIIDAK